jgi:hypothetical protein
LTVAPAAPGQTNALGCLLVEVPANGQIPAGDSLVHPGSNNDLTVDHDCNITPDVLLHCSYESRCRSIRDRDRDSPLLLVLVVNGLG